MSPSTIEVFEIGRGTIIAIIHEKQVGAFDVRLVINGSEPRRVNPNNETKTKGTESFT
jgi:hypothetical protein